MTPLTLRCRGFFKAYITSFNVDHRLYQMRGRAEFSVKVNILTKTWIQCNEMCDKNGMMSKDTTSFVDE